MWGVVNNHIQEAGAIQPHINIFFACFTTRHARLRLCQQGLSLMNPEQVLYVDTDNIIYKRSAGLPEFPTGPYLGQFKDELTEKDTIVECAAAGPKNFGYRTGQGKVEC